ncbi:hypothetical protein U9M48_018202 [Paspalum notatum var. saurae]|uniref:Arabinogalactan peptide 16-like n=1 Tax=Paspalum notatum var. saurae TaxID=547442 RepID=A0AAQ3TCN3_PASNO
MPHAFAFGFATRSGCINPSVASPPHSAETKRRSPPRSSPSRPDPPRARGRGHPAPEERARRFDRCLCLRPTKMAPSSRASVVLVMAVVATLAAAANAQAPAPAPTSDGISVDQGIAYVLMLVALVVTYLIHPLDASSAYKLF